MRNIKKFKTFINEGLSKYEDLVNNLLDKINRSGIQSITSDERTFLDQYNSNSVDNNLYDWLTDDENVDIDGNKLKYDEFDMDEDLMLNRDKLIRVINKVLNKKPYTNNADWGGSYVWNVKNDDNFNGYFIYLGDDDLVYMKRETVDDEYMDSIIKELKTGRDLNNLFVSNISNLH